jgi:hemolysin activation/secretion protein
MTRPGRRLSSLRGASAVVATCAGLWLWACPVAAADDPVVTVQGIEFVGLSGRGLSEADLMSHRIELRDVPAGHLPPQRDVPVVRVTLGELPGRALHLSTIEHVVQEVSRAHTERHLAGVRVYMTRDDLRRVQTGDGVLVIRIDEGRVGAVTATVGADRIAERSPVQPGDVVNLREVNRYVRRLGRHPWRHVDAALAPGDEPGQVALEYLVSQRSPLMLYAQVSNTGTPETTDWRQRFGLTHHDLSGVDDVLSLDYVTGDFDLVHAVFGSYERPLPDREDWRAKVYGGWNRYDASQVGLPDARFTGEGVDAGGELQWTFADAGGFLLDAVGGVRYKHVRTENVLASLRGEADFLLPYVGVRAERVERTAVTLASLTLETNLSRLIGTDEDDLARLGRSNVSDHFTILRGDVSQSLYVTPLFDPDALPGAHELFGSLRGQVVLDRERVAPNFTETAGGFYSVRGYPESFVAGDDALIGTVEYRLHVPQLFPAREEPGRVLGRPFHVAPQAGTGRTDWDLVLRGFVDAAVVHAIDKLSFERDATLLSAGIGAELRLRHNASLRADWGFPLRDVTTSGGDRVTVGSSRVHLSLTLTY